MNKSLKCGSTSLKLKFDTEKDPIKKWGGGGGGILIIE